MVLGVLAAGLDRTFIELGIRPTLPRLSIDRSLRKLAIAEQRTQRDLPDAKLFSARYPPLQQTHDAPPKAGFPREQWLTGTPLDVPIAQDWGYPVESERMVTSHWYLRDSPRPLVILVSGWLPLPKLQPPRLWPIERLDQAGFDVVLPPLPWNRHAARGEQAVTFPGRDPCINIIELARAAGELARIVGWARERGHPRIMLCGMSLGAHLVGLFATLPQAHNADRLVMEKPLSFLSDPIRWHARGESRWCQHVADRLERVYRGVSPLDRKPTVDPERIRVIGATLDRVTPIAAAQAVADHFQVPLQPIRASHLFDPDRSRRLLRLLAD
jgi:hypothetical protein